MTHPPLPREFDTETVCHVINDVEVVEFGLTRPSWRVIDAFREDATRLGWLVQLIFRAYDRDTGRPATQRSRFEFIPAETTESGIVKTCWVLLELAARHELMEAFRYRGARIFDPHRSVQDLGAPR